MTIAFLLAPGCGTDPALPQLGNTLALHSYFDVWKGAPALPGPGFEHLTTNEEQWAHVVVDYQRAGLSGLSPEARGLLIQGAMKAFLLENESVHLKVSVGGRTAQIVERYTSDEDGLHYQLTARRITNNDGVAFAGGTRPMVDLDAPEASSYSQISTDPFRAEVSELRHGDVTCTIDEDAETAYLADLAYYTSFLQAIQAMPLGRQSLAGRDLEVLESPEGALRYWLDPDTLWPVRLELLEVSASQPRSTIDYKGYDNWIDESSSCDPR